MTKAFTGLIPICLFFFALGQFVFIQSLSDRQNLLPWIALGIMILAVLVISPVLLQLENQAKVERNEEDTFQKYQAEFLTDYNRANPITSEDAIQDHIRSLQKMRTLRNTNHLLIKFRERIRNKIFPLGGEPTINFGNTLKNKNQNNSFSENISKGLQPVKEEDG